MTKHQSAVHRSVDAQIRSEFWDLVSRVETGAEAFDIGHAQGRLGITRRRQDGANMRIEFLGGVECALGRDRAARRGLEAG